MPQFRALLVQCFLALAALFHPATSAAPAKVGDRLPDAELLTETGAPVRLRDLAERSPLVIVFYRGGWCPFCTRHLSGLASIVEPLEATGVQLIAITPDTPAKLRARPSHDSAKIPFRLLSDSPMASAQALGIAFRVSDETFDTYKGKYGLDLEAESGKSHRLLPHPSVFVADRGGVIRFAHVNEDYKVRLEPDAVLKAAREVVAPGRRILAADDSTRRLAIVAPDGSTEWEIGVTAIHDAHELPNGNLLLQQGWTRVQEVNRDKQVVWEYDAAKANPGRPVEVHAFQRLPDGSTMVVESGPARILEISPNGSVRRTVKLQVDHPNAHADTRLVRKLENGNYLVAHEADGRVREYDPAGGIVWQFDVPLFGKERRPGHGPEAFGNSVFSATRLANGNTLIGTGNGHSVLEVDRAGKIVWKIEQNDLPGITLAWVTRVERLPTGHTLIGNCHAGKGQPQLIEVTPERKVVWSWTDFTRFGNSTPVTAILPPRR